MDHKKESQKVPFPVEKAGKKELRNELKVTKDPPKTIREFQRSHSLHTMMATAFGTVPANKFKNTRNAGVKESLDSDCVMKFLSHLGIQQYDVHKKISEALLKQLQGAVRSKNPESSEASKQQLLELLKASWGYATATDIPELRDVLVAVLKQLGSHTPASVLVQLGSHHEIFSQLSDSLKHSCWEADLDKEAPIRTKGYAKRLEPTLFYAVVVPHIQEYTSKLPPVPPFVATTSERRVLTTQRRRVAVTDLRSVIGDSNKNKKLLFAAVTLLDPHPTLLADLLVSMRLPAAYASVVALARCLDEIVQAGSITDEQLLAVQSFLRQILPTVSSTVSSAPNTREVLQLVIPSAGLAAMKATDPQKLFWNPVTDEIAPQYSKVITKPICLSDMYEKNYVTLDEWKSDVLLMFQNCVQYNKGLSGKWFRGEANRQKVVFEKEVFPQVHQLVKKKLQEAKKTAEAATTAEKMSPLIVDPKEKKKVQDDTTPDMARLSSRLLSDPFVVRVIADRVLRELRSGVAKGSAIPACHAVIPSLIQLLHFGKSSDGTMPRIDDPDSAAWCCLRRNCPLLVRLIVEAGIDRRTAVGGEWNAVRSTVPVSAIESWDEMDPISTMLFEGALVHDCREHSDVSASFPKFASAIQQADKPFLSCLRKAVLRRKAKIPKSARDAILTSWLQHWLSDNSLNAHEQYMTLLNDWAKMGNAVLPRDAHVQFSHQAVDCIGNEEFVRLWRHDTEADSSFAEVKKQYERMLETFPPALAKEWLIKVGIEEAEEPEEEAAGMKTVEVGTEEHVQDSMEVDESGNREEPQRSPEPSPEPSPQPSPELSPEPMEE